MVKPEDDHGKCAGAGEEGKAADQPPPPEAEGGGPPQLYPEDYDFSIIFDSVENRKARHQMGKHHVEGLVINAGADGE